MQFVYLIASAAAFQLTHLKLFQVKDAKIGGLDPATESFDIKADLVSASVAVGKSNKLEISVKGGAFVSLVRDGAVAWPDNMKGNNAGLPSGDLDVKVTLEKNDIVVIVLPHGQTTVSRRTFYDAFDGIAANTYSAHVKGFCEPLSGKDISVVTFFVKDGGFAEAVDFVQPIKKKGLSPRQIVVNPNAPIVVQDVKQTHDVRPTSSGTAIERNVVVQRNTTVLPGAGILGTSSARKTPSSGSIFQ